MTYPTPYRRSRSRARKGAGAATARPAVEPLESRRLLAADVVVLNANNSVDIPDGDDTPSDVQGTDLGSVALGLAGPSQTFTIQNVGDADVALGAVTIVGSGFEVLASDEPLPSTLSPGNTASFTVRFSAETAGTTAAQVSFGTSAPGKDPYNFTVQATRTAAAPDVDLGPVGSVVKTNESQVSLSAGRDSAGNRFTFHTPEVVAFELAGAQNALTVSAAGANADPEQTGDLHVIVTRDADGDGLLDQSELDADEIDFIDPKDDGAPTTRNKTLAAGRYFAQLKVANFDPQVGVLSATVNYQLSLSSESVQPADIRVTFAGNGTVIADNDSSPGSGDGTTFGTVAVGGNGPERSFVVTNTGGTALTLGAVNAPAGFDVIQGLPPGLNAGQSATFTVKLLSSTAGTKAGQISFSTNVTGRNPFNFSISGTVAGTGSGTPSPSVTLTDIVGGKGTLVLDPPPDSGFDDFMVAETSGDMVLVRYAKAVYNDDGSFNEELTRGAAPTFPLEVRVTRPLSELREVKLSGGAGRDRLLVSSALSVPGAALGGAGDDTLVGGSGGDTLVGEDGDDTLDGGDGNDRLDGQGGADVLAGGGGDDVLMGGELGASPTLAADRFVGGTGNDIADYTGRSDGVTISLDRQANDGRTGSGENDLVGPEDDVETISGSQGPDVLIGNGGRNVFFGNGGNDTLTGNGGDDVLDLGQDG